MKYLPKIVTFLPEIVTFLIFFASLAYHELPHAIIAAEAAYIVWKRMNDRNYPGAGKMAYAA